MEKVKVDVHFRKFNGEDEVTAVFPYEPQTHFEVLCYSHIGQHSECVYYYVQISKPVKETEYAELKKELESIGYELNVIKRRSHKKYMKAYWAKRGAVNIK